MVQIQEQADLSRECRFRVGGPADHFVAVSAEAELAEAIGFARDRGLRWFVYAGGTNLFFDDAGFRGLVVRLLGGAWEPGPGPAQVSVDAGVEWTPLIRGLAERDLGGLEFLANIPGSIGGAVVGNAGCYGHSISDVLVSARLYDTQEGTTLTVDPAFFEYDYRHSLLKYTARYVVLSVVLQARERTGRDVLMEVAEELEDRRTKHPHDAQCAGSYFKNPSRNNAAWKLITSAGLAGARVGDACLSPLHANFLMNAGNATSSDIIALTRLIQRGVYDHTHIALIPEVRYISPEGAVELGPDTE